MMITENNVCLMGEYQIILFTFKKILSENCINPLIYLEAIMKLSNEEETNILRKHWLE